MWWGFQIFSDGFCWYSFHCYLCTFAVGPKMGGAHILLASGAVASAGAQWLGLSCGLTTSSSPPPPGRCHLWQHHCHRHCSGFPNLNPVVVCHKLPSSTSHAHRLCQEGGLYKFIIGNSVGQSFVITCEDQLQQLCGDD